MKPRTTILTASLAFAFSLAAHAQSSDTSGSNAQQPGQSQSAQGPQQSGWPDTQRASKEQCDHLQGNAKTICNAEIKAMKMVQDAKEKVAQHESPQTQLEFAEIRADAKFEIAKARCGDLVGEAKKACEDEATAMRDLTKARAKRQALAQATTQASGSSTSAGTSSDVGMSSRADSSSSAGPSAQTDAAQAASNAQPSRQPQSSETASPSQ
jgi:vacuolar-type H+-ATPase subunit H